MITAYIYLKGREDLDKICESKLEFRKVNDLIDWREQVQNNNGVITGLSGKVYDIIGEPIIPVTFTGGIG